MSEKRIAQLEYDKAQLQEELRNTNDEHQALVKLMQSSEAANQTLAKLNQELRDACHELKMEIFRIEQRLFGVKEIMLIALGLIAGISIGSKFA